MTRPDPTQELVVLKEREAVNRTIGRLRGAADAFRLENDNQRPLRFYEWADQLEAAFNNQSTGHDAFVNPVEGGWNGYRAECECSWKGPLRERKDDAREDAQGHEQSDQPTGTEGDD